MEILPTITTIFDWRGKLKELKALNLNEIALFLTCADNKERREIYEFLKKTNIKRIPFVHMRTDFEAEEIEYLIKNYRTEFFNTHTKREYPYGTTCEKYKKIIYIENTYEPFDEREIKDFAGICLDTGHLENSRLLKPDFYSHNIEMIEKYGVGCSHLSPAVNPSIYNDHSHILKSLSQFDYLNEYPEKYFGKFAALEMENSIKEQLEARNYINNMLL